MKTKITISIFLIMTILSFGQVKIGNNATMHESALMQFSDLDDETNRKGILLPSVLDHKATNADGTLVIDSTNLSNASTLIFDIKEEKIKYLMIDPVTNTTEWQNLTSTGSNKLVLEAYGVQSVNDLVSIINANENNQKQGVIIGSETSNAEGALILESSDRALMLPKIKDPQVHFVDPYPGFICYDTTSESMAIYDGLVWHYWK